MVGRRGLTPELLSLYDIGDSALPRFGVEVIVELFLQAEEVAELQDLLRSAVADLSHEIADTDNWEYRKSLRRRRELLEAVRGRLVPPRTSRT